MKTPPDGAAARHWAARDEAESALLGTLGLMVAFPEKLEKEEQIVCRNQRSFKATGQMRRTGNLLASLRIESLGDVVGREDVRKLDVCRKTNLT